MNDPAMPSAGFGAESRESFEQLLGWLEGGLATEMTHAELEDELEDRGRELLRRMLQDHLSLRTATEQRLEDVADADGVVHAAVEAGHRRALASIFGQVQSERLAYRHRGHANLYPADAALNLPIERHSHGLRRLAAIESSRGSFEQATAAITRATGQRIGKRQVEALAGRAAVDVADFYALTKPPEAGEGDVLVLSADGKGIVMRPDSLRPATAKAAATASTKLATRLSKGEKRNRKRLAEVGAVYDLHPLPRKASDILGGNNHGNNHGNDPPQTPPSRPKAVNKWVTASVVDDAAEVIADVFDEAERRDPDHRRTWIALVDGNNHQIDRIHTEAEARGITLTVVIDLVHVLEYLWAAAWCFFSEADPDAEAWVRRRALAILEGNALAVATGIRRRATAARLPKPKRAKADQCAKYLTNKAEHLDYPTALASGWPIATGIIEGACRYLVADRMDITGARWSVNGAEAVLRLRAVRANGDFDAYWRYHLQRERQRIHQPRYANDVIQLAA
ncbi:MAG TPA: ISKra4 family transposase [Dermatophilaceae bacterium]|nr:ISKra4 family transposase [Dermatophilaceae bacterium]